MLCLPGCGNSKNSYLANTDAAQTIPTPEMIPALYYRKASSLPDESKINNQNLPRNLEIFISHFNVCLMIDQNSCDAVTAARPRNVYAIDFNPQEAVFTTRPLNDSVMVESMLEPIQISSDLAHTISKIAILRNKYLRRGASLSSSKFEEYRLLRESVYKRVQNEIIKHIPPKAPSDYELRLNPRRQMLSCIFMHQQQFEEQCIWYARFRCPEGITLYHASSHDARKLFDSTRSEIILSKVDDEILQMAFINLYVESTAPAKSRYEAADADVKKSADSEEFKMEKRHAYSFLYTNSAKAAQDTMDHAYIHCFQSVNYNLRMKVVYAMMRLYLDAPEEAQKAFDAAWAC